MKYSESNNLALRNNFGDIVYFVDDSEEIELKKISENLSDIEKQAFSIVDKTLASGMQIKEIVPTKNNYISRENFAIEENTSEEKKYSNLSSVALSGVFNESTSTEEANNIIYEAPEHKSWFSRLWDFITGGSGG